MKTTQKFMTMIFTIAVGTLLFAALASAASVGVKTKEGLGSYLTDQKGMTLYLFTKDSANKSVCMAANGCTERWPIFYADKVEPKTGLKAADFGTITREDGKQQTTYKGKPLYYFAKDKDDDDAYGQGVGGVWYVVAP